MTSQVQTSRVALTTWDDCREALERCHIEEQHLVERGLPVHAAVRRRLRLTGRMLALVIEWRRNEARNLENRSAVAPAIPVDELDCMTILRALFLHNWQALQLCRITEEQLAERGLPVQAVMPPVVRLVRKMVAIVIELRRSEARQLLRRDQGNREQPLENPSMRGPRERGTVENHQATPLGEPDCSAMLRALFRRIWEALNRCDIAEQNLADHGCRMSKLLPARMLLSDTLTGISSELVRNDAQALFIQRIAGSEDPSGGPLSDADRLVLHEILKMFSPEDRSILRQIWDRVRPAEASRRPPGNAPRATA